MFANVKRSSLLCQGKNDRQKSFIRWGISAWHFIPHFAYTFVKKREEEDAMKASLRRDFKSRVTLMSTPTGH
jgi:hypothetical protein